MDKKIIGRQYEQKQLARAFESEEAELIAVYGRRRVGKTFLIRRFFEHKDCYYFQATGIYGAPIGLQLKEFKEEIERTFYGQIKGPSLKDPANWMEALGMLTDAIQIFGEQKTVVLFFDEFPWMATHKSGLLQALDYYWNRFWVNDDRIKVIICGSAASWIIDNILNNRGGLHNRVTLRIHLDPFSLYETQAYLKSRGVRLNRQQVLAYTKLVSQPDFLTSFEVLIREYGLESLLAPAIISETKISFMEKAGECGLVEETFLDPFSSVITFRTLSEFAANSLINTLWFYGEIDGEPQLGCAGRCWQGGVQCVRMGSEHVRRSTHYRNRIKI